MMNGNTSTSLELRTNVKLKEIFVDIKELRLKLFWGDDVDALLDEQIEGKGDPELLDDPYYLPYWAILWPAARALAEFLWTHDDLEGKRVLDLGCGIGLVGIVAAMKGAQVTQNDYVEDAIELARHNAQTNGVDNIKFLKADWRYFPVIAQYDYIIASDILYEKGLHRCIKNVLEKSLFVSGQAIIADPMRSEAGSFFELLESSGWTRKTYRESVPDKGRTVHVEIDLLSR